jgi:hypothetical protein
VRVPRVLIGFSLLLGTSFLVSQTNDRHLTSDQAHYLFLRSAYAHGYIHGYEDGFHEADMDIHMGRGERPLSIIKDFRESCNGYHDSFGDKKYFRLGYKQGFREGYSDSMRGVQFRAVGETRRIAEGLNGSTDAQISQRDFDRAFSRGYDVGRDQGANSSTDSPGFDYAANVCHSQLSPSQATHQGESCDAFTRGFSLGFDDGQASRVNRRTQTARR